MKKHILFGLTLITTLTAVQPSLAQESSASVGSSSLSIEGVAPERISDYGLRLNPQIGSSSFEYTGSKAKDKNSGFSGGLTVEFGQGMRKFETGLVYIEMAQSGFITIPMMAKIRLFAMRAQSYYAKFGFATAFETANRKAQASNIDVLAGLGAGGRVNLAEKADLFIEGTYHRGLLNADANSNVNNVHNQGFLVLTGISFSI